MRRALFAAALCLVGCPYQIPDARLVCSERADCPPGFGCRDGTCHRDGAEVPDAGEMGDVPSSDADTCAIDRDGDGACADVDCDDENELVSPGLAEVCTVSTGASPPADEDCDGSIDERCTYDLGEPHWVTDVLVSAGAVSAPHLSLDGRSLYACSVDERGGQVPMVAFRSEHASRFGRLVPIPGVWDEGTGSVAPVDAFAMSPDGSEALVVVKMAAPSVSRYALVDTTFVFQETVGTDGVSPSFAPDGLEMVAVSGGSVVGARRSALGVPFPSLTDVLVGVPSLRYLSASFIGPDALVVTLDEDGQRAIAIARRTGGAFALTDERLPLDGTFESVAYDPAHRELLFTSSRPWSPLPTPSAALWRAEVCRDGACPERVVDCATDVGELLSPDGLHCYGVRSDIAAWAAQQGVCGGTREAHAVTIHSDAERALLATMADDLYWTGGTLTSGPRWFDGEPWTTLGNPWTMGGGDCVTFQTATNRLGNTTCSSGYAALCEHERWPSW